MIKSFIVHLIILTSVIYAQEDITGLWKSRGPETEKPQGLVAIYKYQGKYYGRLLVSYDENGNVTDSILQKKERAENIVGSPPYAGMDIIFNVEKEGDRYKGKIIDPRKGKIYHAEFWREGNDLIVRGEVWIFGKNISWSPGSPKDLPKGISMKDINKFIPVIPEVE